MGSFTDTLENALLDHVFRNTAYTQAATVYSALFTVIPSDSTGGTEVTQASSGYTRVATTFVTAGLTSNGRTSNSGAVNFATVAGGATITVVGWGIMSAATAGAGTLIAWATVTSTVLNVGDQATFPAANIVLTLD